MIGRAALSLFLSAAVAIALPCRAEEPGVAASVIAAAADLRFALDEIVSRFREETGLEIRASYGSSGEFTRQIEQGAPFELFLSADERYVSRLSEQGKTQDDGTLYAIGRIVLFAPTGSALKPDPELRDLGEALAQGRIHKLAIANPEHAPYGRAAEQAMRSRGLWDAARPLLVLGEDAAQAARFASSGSAEGGIIPYSLAVSPAVSALGSFALIPEAWHEPLRQRMVLLRGARETAQRFYRYLQEPAARETLRRFGFQLPAEGA